MWKMLAKFGFAGGEVLEPSCATGVFVHTKPEDTLVTGVELSEISSRIATLLHPNDDIRNESLEKFARVNTDKFDAVIGNVPFGARGASAGDHKPKIHTAEEYFVDTALDQVKGGGLVALIVPTGIMENKSFAPFRKNRVRASGVPWRVPYAKHGLQTRRYNGYDRHDFPPEAPGRGDGQAPGA